MLSVGCLVLRIPGLESPRQRFGRTAKESNTSVDANGDVVKLRRARMRENFLRVQGNHSGFVTNDARSALMQKPCENLQKRNVPRSLKLMNRWTTWASPMKSRAHKKVQMGMHCVAQQLSSQRIVLLSLTLIAS